MKKLCFLFLLLISVSMLSQNDCEIPNGNFQNWSGSDDPVNWITTNMGDKYGTPTVDFDMRNVLKTPGKFGNGVKIKNSSVLEMLKIEKPEAYAKLPASIKEQLRKSSFSGSLFSCQGNCENAILAENEIFMRQNMFFPISKAPGALCGYYKANLKEGDKLWILPYLAIEKDLPAGGVMPNETASVIFENTSVWKPFKIPLRLFPDRVPVRAFIQMQLVGSGFPVTPPYGMNALELVQKYPSTDGSEVFIDELCFCDEADYIDPDDPILDEIVWEGTGGGAVSNDNGNTGDDEEDDSEKIYIATNGSDNNSGTESSPFATLQKALTVAHGKRLEGQAVTIIVKDGIYKQTAEVDWSNSMRLSPLKIKAQNTHQAIFVGSEPISGHITWQKFGPDIYKASSTTLHPDQVEANNDYTNPYNGIAPALVVNGTVLTHTQAVQQTPQSYFFSPQMVLANAGGIDLNTATVEISVLEYAMKITGGGNVSIRGFRFKHFPVPYMAGVTVNDASPGIRKSSNVNLVNCLYE